MPPVCTLRSVALVVALAHRPLLSTALHTTTAQSLHALPCCLLTLSASGESLSSPHPLMCIPPSLGNRIPAFQKSFPTLVVRTVATAQGLCVMLAHVFPRDGFPYSDSDGVSPSHTLHMAFVLSRAILFMAICPQAFFLVAYTDTLGS